MHVSRDGQAVTPEVLQGVTDARERLVSHTQLLPEYRMLVEQEQSVLKGIEPKSVCRTLVSVARGCIALTDT
jgi:hypothetical protein